MANSKDNRNSQVFEALQLSAAPQAAISDRERKKFEDEKSKLYSQLDERVSKLLSEQANIFPALTLQH